MQSLSQCPSYVRALESFDVPALAGSAPSLTHLTKKATTVSGRSPGDQGSAASASESFRAQREAMMLLLGVAASSPSKSPLRKSSKKQSRRSHVGRALDYGEGEDDPDDVSKLPSPAEVINVDKAKARTPAKEPPTQTSLPPPAANATFNPTMLRATKRASLSSWCPPIETSFSLRELDSQLPGASFVLEAPDEEEAQVVQCSPRGHKASRRLAPVLNGPCRRRSSI